MSLTSWLRIGPANHPSWARPRRRPAPPRLGPRLETLEDRTLLTTQFPLVVTSLADSGPGTLRDAITAANALVADQFVIDFGVTGSIDLTSALPDLNKNIAIQGPGAGSLTVQRDVLFGLFDIFTIDAGNSVSISDLTIANGASQTPGAGGIFNAGDLKVMNCTLANNTAIDGGGIDNNQGFVTVTSCTFVNDSALDLGGAINNSSGTVIVMGSTFDSNSAPDGGGINNSAGFVGVNACTFDHDSAEFGGGLENAGTATVTNCTFSGDSATLSGGGMRNDGIVTSLAGSTFDHDSAEFGGGLENVGTATVTNCSFASDLAFVGSGGGIRNIGTATVTNCTLADNRANQNGGGISTANPGGGSTGNLTVTGALFDSNSALNGGGLSSDDSGAMATLTDCTFTGNSAIQQGGGIFNNNSATVGLTNSTLAINSAATGGGIMNDATIMLTNCTIANNFALPGNDGGGIANIGGTVTANNTIVADNECEGSPDFGGALDPSSSFNLIGDGTGLTGISIGTQGNQVGTAANPINPLLGPLQDDGGPLAGALGSEMFVQTLALLPGSPAIDAGGNALAVDAGNNPLITDERGVARIINGTVDIGAFESRSFTVALVSGYGQSATVNTAFLNPLVVTVTSAYGDPVQGGVVTFAAPGSGPGATFPAAAGGATARATIDPAGQAAVAVMANTVAGGYGVTASARGASFPAGFSLTNTPDVARTFMVSDFPSPTIAGAVHTVLVTARDQYGNTATGYAGIVHFTSTDQQAALPLDAMLTNGVGLFSIALKTAGTQSITASDAAFVSLTGTQSGITVNPSVATGFVIAAPGTVTAGTPFTFTVKAVDAYGNVATGYNGTVRFSSSDSKATFPTLATLTNGKGTFTGTFKTKGTQTLTVTDLALPGLTDSLVVMVVRLTKK